MFFGVFDFNYGYSKNIVLVIFKYFKDLLISILDWKKDLFIYIDLIK